MRRFVIGDIHGAHKELVQCFERSGFDYENDKLICLGDVADRGANVAACFDELLKIKHLVYVLGNHDKWFLNWAKTGEEPEPWLKQGGKETQASYDGQKPPQRHVDLLQNAVMYHLEDDNLLFVHGGINPSKPLEEQDEKNLLWGRGLATKAITDYNYFVDKPFTDYKEIFVGHTHIDKFGHYKPLRNSGVCLMDTGAGHGGKLSMMDLDSGEVFQSDAVKVVQEKGQMPSW